jgi:hypothetical protein
MSLSQELVYSCPVPNREARFRKLKKNQKKKEKKIEGPGEGKASGLEEIELKRGGDYAGA